jgi:hypothetical protein
VLDRAYRGHAGGTWMDLDGRWFRNDGQLLLDMEGVERKGLALFLSPVSKSRQRVPLRTFNVDSNPFQILTQYPELKFGHVAL